MLIVTVESIMNKYPIFCRMELPWSLDWISLVFPLAPPHFHEVWNIQPPPPWGKCEVHPQSLHIKDLDNETLRGRHWDAWQITYLTNKKDMQKKWVKKKNMSMKRIYNYIIILSWQVNECGASKYCLKKKVLGHWRQILSYRPCLGKEVTN